MKCNLNWKLTSYDTYYSSSIIMHLRWKWWPHVVWTRSDVLFSKQIPHSIFVRILVDSGGIRSTSIRFLRISLDNLESKTDSKKIDLSLFQCCEIYVCSFMLNSRCLCKPVQTRWVMSTKCAKIGESIDHESEKLCTNRHKRTQKEQKRVA